MVKGEIITKALKEGMGFETLKEAKEFEAEFKKAVDILKEVSVAEGDKVKFGSLEVTSKEVEAKTVPEHEGINPKTKEKITIAEKFYPACTKYSIKTK